MSSMSAASCPEAGLDEYHQLGQTVRNIGGGGASGFESRFDSFSESLAAASERVQQNGATRVLTSERDVVGTFVESSQAVMHALDAVQQAHPFIAAVVLAFKAAIELELTRRENDGKVVLIKSRMLDAVDVLIELKDIKNPGKPAADSTTIERRLERILRALEKDIRDCSALCEKYVQKRFIVKLFDGARWQARLAEYDAIFSEHRAQLSLALTTHVACGIDGLHVAVHGLKAVSDVNVDRTSMLLLFKQLERPTERELLRYIAEHGGAAACLEDEQIFNELRAQLREDDVPRGGRLGVEDAKVVMAAIRMEMRSDLGHALAEDRLDFNTKFNAVQTQLEDMRNTVSHSGERLLSAIHAGPHDQLIDQDMYNMWKEMGWKRRVKGRHFVAALHDYFFDKCSANVPEAKSAALVVHRGRHMLPTAPLSLTRRSISRFSGSSTPRQSWEDDIDDRWALRYVTLSCLRPIVEALDHDASGWVKVRDVNAFTTSRPRGYSVLKWVSFWAVGFPTISSTYARKAQSQRARMDRAARRLLPCNQARVDRYLSSGSVSVIDHLLRGPRQTGTAADDDASASHFEDYVDSEYRRLQQNLDLYQWHIDMSNTLSLVMDNRPIEHLILPLLALLLQRHADIMQLATKYPLNDLELYDAQKSLETVAQGIGHRLKTLTAIYESQNLDPRSQLGKAFSGMFSVLFRWIQKTNPSMDVAQEASLPGDPEPLVDIDILSYGIGSNELPQQFYCAASPAEDPFCGLWAGYYLSDDGCRQGWLALNLRLQGKDRITGSGQDTIGKFTIEGTMSVHRAEDGEVAALYVTLRKARR
ncbi:hypothetical protein AURDEDRAFT_170608 [Auricularia subglabra TFB-10046 SS5]|nr:hypothetical protein AURDEDRAFT_170608 [Auricularia subglabra TFB-10046 SS5]